MVNNDSCCFAKILKVIEILQNSSTNPACCEEGCDKPFLGPNQNFICYNTRPVQFYTRAGTLFSASYTQDEEVLNSNVFRVEKVDDLKCMCVLKCLNDVALENI